MKTKMTTLLCVILVAVFSMAGIAYGEKENPGFERIFQGNTDSEAYRFDITEPVFTLDESYETFEKNDIMQMYSTFVCAWADLYDYEINTMKIKEKNSIAAAALECAEKGMLLGYVIGTDNKTEHINIFMEYALIPNRSIATLVWMDYDIATHELRGYKTTTTTYSDLPEMSRDMMLGLFIRSYVMNEFPNTVCSDPVVGSDALYDMMKAALKMIK